MSYQIIVDGIKFTRDKKTGYYLASKKVGNKRPRLHVYIWEKNNGQVPKGYEIHHKDGDKDNNDISNFELLPRGKHQELHGADIKNNEVLLEKMRTNLKENATPKASEWHKSKEGREWHRKHAIEVSKNLSEKEFICSNCGKTFNKKPQGNIKFCSNKCKSAWRRKQGLDNITRVCEICGKKFEVNKYSTTKTCSKQCAANLRKKNR
jgi:endogenous inhibitor of DNA gyrase (YacG/DUF329 family)